MASLREKVKSLANPSALTVLTAMLFWGQVQNYMMRINLSILIVAMVKPSKGGEGELVAEESCIAPDSNSLAGGGGGSVVSDGIDDDRFEWDEFTRGQLLAAFSYGYVTTQLIGGRLAEVYGVKLVYGVSLVGTALLSLLSPVVARWHTAAFIALRVLQGVFEGATFPAAHVMAARWVPIEERSSFIARAVMGSTIGMVVTFPLCAFLIESLGWESAFYIIGASTLVWAVFWYFLVFDNPEKHPRIGAEEKERLVNALKKSNEPDPLPVPWKSVATSVPFLALVVTDMASCFGAFTFFTNWPTYLKFMLGTDIKTNGLLSALPFVCRYAGGLIHGKMADTLYARGTMSLVNVRRVFNSICLMGPALSLVLLSWSGCDTYYVVALVCFGFFFNGAMSPGHFASYTDLAPNFAGTIFGISNTFSGGGVGFTVPLFIGAITQGNMTFSAWRIVFLTGAGVYAFGTAVYIAFIQAKPQPWNYRKATTDTC